MAPYLIAWALANGGSTAWVGVLLAKARRHERESRELLELLERLAAERRRTTAVLTFPQSPPDREDPYA